MPVFSLVATAELESVASVSPLADIDAPFMWRILFSCNSCREAATSASVLDITATFDLPSGHGLTNLVQNCKFCSAAWTADIILPKSAAALTSECTTATLAEFECRGCTPVTWLPGDGWRVIAAGGADTWDAVDLCALQLTQSYVLSPQHPRITPPPPSCRHAIPAPRVTFATTTLPQKRLQKCETFRASSSRRKSSTRYFISLLRGDRGVLPSLHRLRPYC